MNRFVNLDGSEHAKLPKMIKGIRKTIEVKIKSGGAPAPSMIPKLEELSKSVDAGDGARITWLGHAGWLVQTEGI